MPACAGPVAVEACLGGTPLGEALFGEPPFGELPLGEPPFGEPPFGEPPFGGLRFGGLFLPGGRRDLAGRAMAALLRVLGAGQALLD